MQLKARNYNLNSFAARKDNVNFTGLNTGKIAHLGATQAISKCHLDDTFETLSRKVGADFIQNIGGENVFKKANSFADTLKYPFIKLPKEILSSIADKFNIKSLQNSKLLTDFKKAGQDEAYQRAMRGLLQNSDNFINMVAKENGLNPADVEKFICKNGCNPVFQDICDDVTKKFYELFDSNLAKDKAHYHTPHERTVVRMVSGVTAAIMLGNDFYNKSIMNGMSDKEANEAKNQKRKQEIIATSEEAISQYFMLGAFSGFANNSKLGAPILNTALGILFHISSRLTTGTPLTRIKLEDKAPSKFVSMNDFVKSAKENKSGELVEETADKKPEKEKKHILTLKNILLATAASIGVGFALEGLKNTKAFDKLKQSVLNLKPVKTARDKFRASTVGEVWVSRDEVKSFTQEILPSCGFAKMGSYYKKELLEAFSNPKLVKQFKNPDGTVVEKILLGEYEKMTTIPFTKIQMSKRELMQVPLMPFKFVTELASYPYKAAHKILEDLKVVEKPKEFKLKNDYHILNTYIDFKEQLAKHGGEVNDEFIEFFKKHTEANRISALNKETQSGVKNAAIGKTTQLLGTFGSLYFAMTDDYNRTAKQTGDKQKAAKDARLRGVNKIIRIATQIVVMGINDIFKIPYAKSIMGAGAITAACTVMTDSISRTLSGMPFKKMNKEELEQYNKNKKEGILKGYYNALDKLTD